MKALHSPQWIVVHTQASPDGSHGTVESIRQYHVEDLGWEEIGYHVVINGAGVARPGRSERYQGAGVSGFNARSLHVCCTGNGDLAPFTPAQVRALLGVVRGWMEAHRIPVERVLGHRECYGIPGVPNTGKTCPGRLVNMHEIRAALAADPLGAIPVVPPRLAVSEKAARPAAPTVPPHLDPVPVPAPRARRVVAAEEPRASWWARLNPFRRIPMRAIFARFAAAIVAVAVTFLAGTLGIEVTEDTRATLTEAVTLLGLGLWGVVYAVVHRLISRKVNPMDAAKT